MKSRVSKICRDWHNRKWCHKDLARINDGMVVMETMRMTMKTMLRSQGLADYITAKAVTKTIQVTTIEVTMNQTMMDNDNDNDG